MHVIIKSTRDGEAVETVSYPAAAARIDELAGRNIGAYILGKFAPAMLRLHGRESAPVGTAKGSPGRAIHGQTFHIEVVR
jgi:hypothetical protein